MGAVMCTIYKSLAWAGSDVTLSMFTVSDAKNEPELDLSVEPSPIAVRRYALEDEDRVLSGQSVVEYDLVFRDVPSDLNGVIRQCFRVACSAGVRVAWFGFEGSFDFQFLLTKEIANQIYAVSDSHGVSIASDEMLSSESWEARVVGAGIEARRESGPSSRGI
jgi:hypothetical protein